MDMSQGIDKKVLCRYLSLYVADLDWEPHIARALSNIQNDRSGAFPTKEEQLAELKKRIAFTILGPKGSGVRIPEQPETLLLTGYTFWQYKEKDWTASLIETIKSDEKIEHGRNQCLSLGIVYPIEYSPITRQAFNWLFTHAKEARCVTEENKQDMIRRCQNLVLAYGGSVICSIFLKHEYKLKKIANWRTGYFFEKVIFETYTLDQLLKIKKAELAKTNPKLVKQIRND